MPSIPSTNAVWRPTSLPAALPAPQAVPAAAAAPTLAPCATRCLTPTEMAEQRRQGLCYNCDVQYVLGHRCTRLFLIKLDDFAPGDAPLEDEPKTPLHPFVVESEDVICH